MRFILSLSTFVLTMVLALIAFTYTAINYPTAMRDLLAGAQHVRDAVQLASLPDSYMVWVDIFLQPNQIVLVGFSIAMRIVLGLLFSLFPGARRDREEQRYASTPASQPPPSKSPFGRWG
ncbi:MAG: hypothetical protein WAN43_01410 [Rhodomicrobium sp.]